MMENSHLLGHFSRRLRSHNVARCHQEGTCCRGHAYRRHDLANWPCIDDIVPEPEGGAHRDHEAAAALLDANWQKHYADLKKLSPAQLLEARYKKFRNIAQFYKTD